MTDFATVSGDQDRAFANRLLAYSAMAGASLLAPPVAGAVVYRDLDPDVSRGYNQAYDLDLDSDGTTDVTLVIRQDRSAASGFRSSYRRCQAIPAAGNALQATAASAPLNSNYLLGNPNPWATGTQQLAYFSTSKTPSYPVEVTSGGAWLGAVNKFIGIRFQHDPAGANTTHYGWIRLSVAPQAKSFTVSDYAYDDTPDTAILTGAWLDIRVEGAPGSRFWLEADDVDPLLAGFVKRPKVTGSYFDPLKSGKPKKAAAGVLTAIAKGAAPDSVRCEWKKAVRLFNAKTLQTTYNRGETAQDFLVARPPSELNFALQVGYKDGAAAYDRQVWQFRLKWPTVTNVTNQKDVVVAQAGLGQLLKINGQFFGKKPPKAWLEYRVGGKTKKLPLKALKPLPFADAANKPGASCMNPDTGESQFRVQMPYAWPSGWQHGVHNLVLDNGVGLAVHPFGTAP